MLRQMFALSLWVLPHALVAQDKEFGLSAPDALIANGFLNHLLPRFSLKSGVRIAVNGDVTQAAFHPTEGQPVFRSTETVWHLRTDGSPHALRFAAWLSSDVGQRTIEAFEVGGTAVFTPIAATDTAEVQATFDGNARAGERLSLSLCGRCHVVNETNRMKAIGSTPSFGVLRTLSNWSERFEAFYVLRPHGAFTQIAEVTAPFDAALPSPIAPVEMTLEELDAILAYVATITPANLGQPIQSQ